MKALKKIGCAAALWVLGLGGALAQTTLTIIVPTTPGTGSDITARLLAPVLSKSLGQAVVVENRTGASGTIGIAAVAKAAPDGNTVLFVPNTMAMISSLYKNMPWDPVTSFEPVATVGKMLVAAATNPDTKLTSLEQLVASAKSKPGQMNYGSPGSGTPHHLRTEQFKQIAGVDIVHVPYKGSAGAVTDLTAGQVQFGIFPLHSLLPMTKAGKLRMLATSGETRSPWTPDVPTFRESGITVLNDYDWVGVFLPKNTPRARVDALSHAIVTAVATPDMREQFAARGIIANPGGPAEMAQLLRKELVEWNTVVQKGHIVAE
jgi:tripartite-type tricarboxylate transporter receptor subunit TctC